jgi:GAF domain-containing protein
MSTVKEKIDCLEHKLEAFVKEFAERFQADAVTLFLYDSTTDEFDLPIEYGLIDKTTFKDPAMRPRPDKIAGKIAREKREYIGSQVAGHPDMDGPFARRERIRSAAGFPLVHNDTTVGVLFINYRKDERFLNETLLEEIRGKFPQVAAIIAQANIFPALRQNRFHPKSEEEKTLDAIVKLACSALNLPLSIWLLEPHGLYLRIRASIGLTHSYISEARAKIGDGSAISQAIEAGEPQTIRDIYSDSRFRYHEHARAAGWRSMLVFPIKFRGHTSGAIEFFTFEPKDFEPEERYTIQFLADTASVAIENTYRSREAEKIAQVARSLSGAPDFNSAMRVIVDSACQLTGADSSTIVLLEKRSDSFIVGRRTPPEAPPAVSPRSEGGLTRYIIETGEPLLIKDTTSDPRVSEAVVREGIRSLLGVRVQLENERIGVLYVEAKRNDQFNEHDIRLLRTVADQASVALGWARLLLKPSEEIEQATSELFRLEEILDSTCNEIKNSEANEYDLVSIQLIGPEEDFIETVHGIGLAGDWPGRFKHPLLKDRDLRDIQADLVLAKPPRLEIIRKWDWRFNQWIYDKYHHERFVRAYAPIILVRGESGNLVSDWVERCNWEIRKEREKTYDKKRKRGGEITVVEMDIPDRDTHGTKLEYEIIGTVEVGYEITRKDQKSKKEIEPEQAIRLANLVAKQAIEIRTALLPYVLESIVEHAMQIVRADSASLHFLYEPNQHRYIYEVCAGHISRRFLKAYPPRENGLGQQAIQEKKPKFIPDPSQGQSDLELKNFNPEIYAQGVKAMAAFPLLIGQKNGVLYVHFQREHRFTETELGWVQLFANRAADTIRHVTTYTQMHDRARQLSSLHSVGESLVSSLDNVDLLNDIAWNTLNILAADVVTIYEYIEDKFIKLEKRFVTPPTIAGRLRAEKEMITEIDEVDALALLVKSRSKVYAEKSVENRILNNPDRIRSAGKGKPFVMREKIESSAGTLLKVGTEIVGVLFINYRRPHSFSEYEKKIIDTLASSAAIAIKNRRLLEALSAGSREIITTLDLEKVLNLIVQRAVQITRAEVGEIRRLDLINQELVVKARHPTNVPIDVIRSRIKVGEGITGAVAADKQSVLVIDLESDFRYQAYFADIRSALCVPLLDGERRILGTLTVGSKKRGAFNKRSQIILEALADQAVIAVQNAEHQKQLIAAETMATLGDLAGPLVHWMNNEIGAIKVLAQDIHSENIERDEMTGHKASRIYALAEKALREAQGLKRWIPEKPQPVNLSESVSNAIARINIPSNIEQKIGVPNDLPNVSGSKRQILDVLTNLIINAIDAMPKGGKLHIGAKTIQNVDNYWISIWVRDTGTGISEEDVEKIFQRNFSTKEKGLGLGLWWTRIYIERLGGSLTVDSRPGEGTEFTVTLPAFD